MIEQLSPADHARSRRRQDRWRTLRTVLLLAAFWLLLSGHFEPLPLALGALSIAVVGWLSWRAGPDLRHDGTAGFLLRLPRLLLWLAAQVLISAFAVARKAWSPRPTLHPDVATVPAPNLRELSRVVYANSITLTPGTLSLKVTADRIEVHSLDEADIDDLRTGAMLDRVRRTEAHR